MQSLFMDESGDLGFGPGGSSYFIIGFVAPKVGKDLSKCIKNFNAHLIRNGWNGSVEIKATNVWHARKNPLIPASFKYRNTPEVPMRNIMESIADIDGYIECTVVKLDTISARLQTAPCAILYNHFSWQLLKGPLSYFSEVQLFADRRNRENHSNLKFDGYIDSKAGLVRARIGKPPISLRIHHLHWDSPAECTTEERPLVNFGVRGIEAADFICWAIKKKYENNDETWYSLLQKKIRWTQHLYFKAKAATAGAKK